MKLSNSEARGCVHSKGDRKKLESQGIELQSVQYLQLYLES